MKSFSELTSASQVNNGDLIAISQTSGSGYASKKTTVKDITDKSNLNLADEYDSTSTYAVDDYVIYESVLYKCIASTTGTFDSTKWTSVVVTDEMGSGGGGGTGGHTIIDENGNSMTARAGLQFVGANVSDDATNNKTIVDLASAGGIDGVFIDIENVIQASTTLTANSTTNYTATEDCVIRSQLWTGGEGKSSSVSIDGVELNTILSSSGSMGYYFTFLLKKGQVATFEVTGQSAYTVYGIQTGTTHSKFQPVIYSTEEREIGVWTDGKPLYEKTFYKDNLATTFTDFIKFADMDNPETFVSIRWSAIRDLGSSVILKYTGNGASYTEAQSINHYILMRGYGNELQYRLGDNYGITEMWATVQYTKTTDVAGSGSWTPQGVPTHHYSTDEHIVGTWMGETLWEKTYDFSSNYIAIPAGTNWKTTDIDSSNMGVITSVLANHSDGTMYNDMSADPTGNNHTKLNLRSVAGASVFYLTLQYTKLS